MRIYKEKHIEYDFAVKGTYMYDVGERQGKAYSGPIIKWKGRVYAGTKLTRYVEINNRLAMALDGDNPYEDEIKREYDKLKPEYIKYLIQPTHINFQPTKKDYGKGFCIRHFVRWEENIYEVDKDQYDKLEGQSSVYIETVDFAKYKHFLEYKALDINRANIAEADLKAKGIADVVAITDFMRAQENLYTPGGEFHLGKGWKSGFTRIPDNVEYEGYYHIHPQRGPMVGKYHTEQPHQLLIPIKKADTAYQPKIDVPDE